MADVLGSLLGGLSGGAIGSAIVQLRLDTANYEKEMLAAQGQTKAGAEAMGTSMTKFGAIAKAGALVAGAAVIGFAANAVRAASDQGEALNKSNVIFEKSAGEVAKWADTGAKAFGLSKTASLDAAAGFGSMLQTAGLATDKSADMSMAIVQLAGDMASFNNIDPTEALDKLRSGLSGEAEPLRRFGVFLSEAAVQQEAYQSGIAETGKELTEAQKVQARYNIIFEQTAKQQGDFARTADSLPNQMRTLKAEFENISAEVGTALLPAFTQLLGAVGDLLQAFKPFLIVLGEAIGLIAKLASVATDPIGAFRETAAAVEESARKIATGTATLEEHREAYERVAGGARPAAAGIEAFRERVEELEPTLLGATQKAALVEEGILNVGGATAKTKTKVKELEEATVNFAHLTTKEMNEWKKDMKEAFTEFSLSLDESGERTVITRKEFHDATVAMRKNARDLSEAMVTIRNENWINDRYVKFLAEQGPEWLIQFANMTKEQQKKAQDAWKESTEFTDRAKNSLDKITGALDEIGKGRTKHVVEIHYKYVDFDPSKPGMQTSGTGQR